jgi:hypothetical protein
MRFVPLLCAVAFAHAQGISPKPNVDAYPVHAQMDAVTLGAEYMVHSLPTPSGLLLANDYLVIEVGFFGPTSSRLKLSPDQFTLRINGNAKGALLTQLPGMVASSMRSIGGPVPRNDRAAPIDVNQSQADDSVDARINNASLPEGEHSLPRAGLIYFPFKGKTKNIRSLDLLYDGPMGKATLKLL